MTAPFAPSCVVVGTLQFALQTLVSVLLLTEWLTGPVQAVVKDTLLQLVFFQVSGHVQRCGERHAPSSEGCGPRSPALLTSVGAAVSCRVR